MADIKKVAKLVELRPSNSAIVLDRAAESARKGELCEMILMYRNKDDVIETYWIGRESSLRCLGMAQHMVGQINDYISDHWNDEE